MAIWTANDLAIAALRRMSVLATGQTATAEDLDGITTSWRSIHRNLRTEGLAPFPFDAIPEEAQHSLSHILADANAGDFGLTGERAALIAKDAQDGISTLQKEYAAEDKKLPTRVRYF